MGEEVAHEDLRLATRPRRKALVLTRWLRASLAAAEDPEADRVAAGAREHSTAWPLAAGHEAPLKAGGRAAM